MYNDYVQHLFQSQFERERLHGRLTRILPWVFVAVAGLSLAAYGLREYWYPYVAPYLPL
jgi:hypothetical protein